MLRSIQSSYRQPSAKGAKQISKPHRSNWKHLKYKVNELKTEFPKDGFLADLLEGMWLVARDKSNPIRGNLVASALREVFGHIVHSLAPDAEVRKCVWFEQAKDTKTTTRRQKSQYIVQAGLSDSFVKNDLGLEIDDYVIPLLDAFKALNRATHVRAETIVSKSKDVRLLIESVLDGLLELLEAASHARADLEHAVSEKMHHAVFENLISETIQELDELSTHTTVDGHFIENVDVVGLSSEQVVYEVTGRVEVELQYGSNSDVRNDMGVRIDDSYPYTATAISRAAAPMKIQAEDISLTVDNGSFYE